MIRTRFRPLVWMLLASISEMGAILLAVTLLRINFSLAMALAGGLFGGVMVALAHWFSLRGALQVGVPWVLASAAGWSLGWIVFGLEFTADQVDLLALSVIGPMMGAGIIPAQWIMLRRHLARSFRWVPLMLLGRALGAGAGIGVALSTYTALETSASLNVLVLVYLSLGVLASAAGTGLCTGLAAWGLLRNLPEATNQLPA